MNKQQNNFNRYFNKVMCRLTVACVLAGLCLLAAPRAEAGGDLADAYVTAGVIWGGLGLGATISGLVSVGYETTGTRPPAGWLVADGIFGTFATLAGIACLANTGPDIFNNANNAGRDFALSLIPLAIGVGDYAALIYGLKMPKSSPVKVIPQVSIDPQGHVYAGIGIQTITF